MNRSESAYFKEAVEGNTVYSDVFIDDATGTPIVVLSMPVYNGGLVGVIATNIDLSFLSQMATEIGAGEGGDAYIVDDQGRVIAHPDTSLAESLADLSTLTPVQAVMAGEAGRGFAVVAEEIRKLAEQSTSSAESITGILDGIRSDVKTTGKFFNANNDALKAVVSETEITRERIEKVLIDAQRAMEAVESIAAVSEEQAAGAEEMKHLMEDLIASIETTASTSEEISASTEEQTAGLEQMRELALHLEEMATTFNGLIDQFKTEEEAANDGSENA